MKLEFGVYSDNQSSTDHVFLKLFTQTTLILEAFIPTKTLQDFFTHSMLDYKLTLKYWGDEKSERLPQEYTLNELLKDCEEIREYARQYFPEHAV